MSAKIQKRMSVGIVAWLSFENPPKLLCEYRYRASQRYTDALTILLIGLL
jgi:hypothetical protein